MNERAAISYLNMKHTFNKDSFTISPYLYNHVVPMRIMRMEDKERKTFSKSLSFAILWRSFGDLALTDRWHHDWEITWLRHDIMTTRWWLWTKDDIVMEGLWLWHHNMNHMVAEFNNLNHKTPNIWWKVKSTGNDDDEPCDSAVEICVCAACWDISSFCVLKSVALVGWVLQNVCMCSWRKPSPSFSLQLGHLLARTLKQK